jgi:hypothetical protein
MLPLPDLRLLTPPPRDELLSGLRARLGDAAPGWRGLAEDILGASARIDFVGVQPGGRLTAVLVGSAGEDLALVARGLAQSEWLEARIPDWMQLSRDLAIRPDLAVQAVLLCTGFRPEAQAAAHALGDRVRLATYRWVRSQTTAEPLIEILLDDTSLDDDELAFEPVQVPSPPQPSRGGDTAVARAPEPDPEDFRTDLSDEDLGLSPEELSEFD